MDHLRRELRVAFSTKAQSVRFRVMKWILIGIAGWLLRAEPWFGWAISLALVAGLALHFFWRFKTNGWTQPWGGWNDIE